MTATLASTVAALLLAVAAGVASQNNPSDGRHSDAEALAREGRAAEQRGNLGEAIADFRRALEIAPDDTGIRIDLGQACYRAGDLSRARFELEGVHADHPENVQAAVLLGFTYNKLGRTSDTLALLQPLEAGNRGDDALEYALAFAMIQSGDADQGLVRMEALAPRRPSGDGWMIAAAARFGRKQYAQARADAEQAVKVSPEFPGAYTLLGQAQYAVGQVKEAAVSFERALRLDPRDFTANLYLGILRFDDRDVDTARPLLEMALGIHPENPLARLEMARLMTLQGDTRGALELLEGLAKSDPNWLDPHVELVALYYKLHRTADGARERAIVQDLESKQQQQGPH